MDNYKDLVLPERVIRVTSIIQIVVGVLCALWQIGNMTMGDLVGFIGTGLWCGVAFILAGFFGLSSLKTNQPCGLGAWLSFSLLSIPLALTLLAFSLIGAFLESTAPHDVPISNKSFVSTTPYPMRTEKFTIDVILGLCSVIALVSCIIATIVSCRGLCRLRPVSYRNMDCELDENSSSNAGL